MLHPMLALTIAVGVALCIHRFDAVTWRWRPPGLLEDGAPALAASLGYTGLLLLTNRPLTALLLTVGGALLASSVVRLKLKLFQEPTVFLDAALSVQIIRHPGFYVPYMFPPPVLACGAAGAVALSWLAYQEPPCPPAWWRAALAFWLLAGAWLLWQARLFLPAYRPQACLLLATYNPTLDAKADFHRFGFVASLVLHVLWHVQARGRGGRPGIPRFEDGRRQWATVSKPIPPQPHMVLVQAETFFDVRLHLPDAPQDLLQEVMSLQAQGTGGPFLVQTHGAYTMRTEFSVLTGQPLTSLGTDAFNPYFTASRRNVWSLAWQLREWGYRTCCIHPFHLSFFRRDRVLPNLGFDVIQGLGTFEGAPRCGPYVCDMALADRVLEWLGESTTPAFVFVITMEAHGPWNPGRAPGASTPEAIFMEHLRHTDAMFGRMAEGLGSLAASQGRHAILGGYGDHVGCLPALEADPDSGITPTLWFLWDTGTSRQAPHAFPPHPSPLRPDAMPYTLLERARSIPRTKPTT